MLVKMNEKATLIVGGNQFSDWTSISVQRIWGDAYDQFTFSCAERDGATATDVRSSSQFKPGDECRIELAGQLAVTGEIVSRQTAYDAKSRGVQLHGTSQTWAYATSSVIHKTNSFDGKTFKEIVKEVFQPTGLVEGKDWEFKGQDPQKVFRYCNSEKGETNFAFLERLAKNVKVIITCDEKGRFIFVCEGRSSSPQGQLIEGRNIRKMQCVVSNQQAYKKFIVSSQTNANDKLKYVTASEQRKEGPGRYPGKYRTKETPMEQPTTDETGDNSVAMRVENERMWAAGTEINATVVVQGWQPAGSGELWQPGSNVTVHSPMAMLQQQEMAIQSITYTQDNTSGSLTTLVCVSENVLNGPKQSFAVAK